MDPKLGTVLPNTLVNNLDFLNIYKDYQIFIYMNDHSFLIALDQSQIVCGCFEFIQIEYNEEYKYQLAHMYVHENHKRLGIGKAILREAVNLWNTFELPSNSSENTYYYIEHGYSFILSCFRDGILTEPNFKSPEN